MIEYANRTLIATVVFVDIVDYSERTVSEQMQVKIRFKETVSGALADVAANERILLDTGDGAALCFLGDPENSLFVAHSLRDAARDGNGEIGIPLRIGINVGPIKLIKDINDQPNVIGDAINAAQRIMSFADPNQILVSRSFYELVSCLKPEYGRLFHYLGVRQDKHVREHELYSIDFVCSATQAELNQEESSATLLGTAKVEFPQAILTQLGVILNKYMGPIAKVLVRKASRECMDLEQLCQCLAKNIPVEAQRSVFLHEAESLCGIVQEPPVSIRSTHALDPQQIAAVEQHLARHIGPLAKVLVRRAQRDCSTLAELCGAMAQHIENARDREAFLSTFEERA